MLTTWRAVHSHFQQWSEPRNEDDPSLLEQALKKQVVDSAGNLKAFKENKPALSKVESVLIDGGYIGQPFANAANEILAATVQVATRSELHALALIPQCWIVERSLA